MCLIPQAPKTYYCWFDQEPVYKGNYTRFSASQAKAAFWRDMQQYLPASYTYLNIRARSLGKVVACGKLKSIASFRGVAFVEAGMRVQVCNKFGFVVGAGGGGAWLEVLFDDGTCSYFHPQGDRTKFFNDEGRVIYNSRNSNETGTHGEDKNKADRN